MTFSGVWMPQDIFSSQNNPYKQLKVALLLFDSLYLLSLRFCIDFSKHLTPTADIYLKT